MSSLAAHKLAWLALVPAALLWWCVGYGLTRSGSPREHGVRLEASTVGHFRHAVHQTETETAESLVGSTGCAGATCHGSGSDRSEAWRSSYSVWRAHDPHVVAARALWTPGARRMVERLDSSAVGSEARYREVLGTRCAPCHSTYADEWDDHADAVIQSEGVSCESCHGRAAGWLESHRKTDYEGPAERNEVSDLAVHVSDSGQFNTRDVVSRAAVCVGCHVGDGSTREVNHDLIAAGHPPLRFDFSLYHALLPQHWPDAGVAESAATRWTRGEIVTLAATLHQTRSRAANPEAPWPEFAEYSCFGCHHDLHPQGFFRRDDSLSQGWLQWQSWYAATVPGWSDGEDLLSPIRSALQGEIGSIMRTDRDDVVAACDQALNELRSAVNAPTMGADDLIRNLLVETEGVPRSWEDAARQYLAVESLVDGNSSFDQVLGEWHAMLEFTPGYNSTEGWIDKRPNASATVWDRLNELKQTVQQRIESSF